jgi:hypothetical protein
LAGYPLFAIAFLAAAGGFTACARTVSTLTVGCLDLLNIRDVDHCLSPFISRFIALSNGLTDVA